jgi:hypothetical protein
MSLMLILNSWCIHWTQAIECEDDGTVFQARVNRIDERRSRQGARAYISVLSDMLLLHNQSIFSCELLHGIEYAGSRVLVHFLGWSARHDRSVQSSCRHI